MKSLPFKVMGVANPAGSYIDENKDTTRRLVVREEEESSALVNGDGSLSRRVSYEAQVILIPDRFEVGRKGGIGGPLSQGHVGCS